MRRTLAPRAAGAARRARRSRSRAGCTGAATLAAVTFVVVRDRPAWPRWSSRTRRRSSRSADGEETVVAVTGTVTRQPAGARRRRGDRRRVRALTEPAATPPVELWRPTLDAGAADAARPRRGDLRHPAQRARVAARGGAACAASGRRWTRRASPRSTARSWSRRRPSPARTCSRSTTSAGRRTSPSRPQFYKQMLVGVFERVYEVGPVFRAEPHDTVRHLAEYVSLDVELGFIRRPPRRGGGAARRASPAWSRRCTSTPPRPSSCSGVDVPVVPDEIPVLHFREALEIAGAPADEPDLAPGARASHRRVGAGASTAATSSSSRATRRRSGRSTATPTRRTRTGRSSFDLIFRGVELVSGAQRLHRYDDYVAALAARGYPLEAYASYVDAFRYGVPPHGGFAIGLERWVSRLTGRPTSGRSRCSRATCTGSRRSGAGLGADA